MRHSAFDCTRYLWGLLFTALLGSCRVQPASTDPDPAANAAARRDPQSLRVVHLGYQKIGPPFLLKSRAGSLELRLREQGARPEWVEFQAGPPLLEAMRAGAVDIGYAGETPPVFAQAGGVPLVYVALDPPAPQAEAIVVPRESKLQTLAELKGKRVALNRGSNVHYLLVRALESAGLSLSDLTVVYLAPADARSAFESGQVDAWVIWDPFLAAVELSGARLLRDGSGLVDNNLFYLVRREFGEREPGLVATVLDEYRSLSEWAATGLSRTLQLLLDGPLQMLRAIPALALVPLVILWFGLGEAAKLFLVALSVLFPVYLNTFHGVRSVDPTLLEMARVYDVRGWRLYREIILPGALPSILVGLRFALGMSWLVLIVAESIGATRGLGYVAMNAREFMQLEPLVLTIVLWALLGKLSDVGARSIERRLLPWQPKSQRLEAE